MIELLEVAEEKFCGRSFRASLTDEEYYVRARQVPWL